MSLETNPTVRPTIEVLVGMIGSGKSTYARRRADAGALVISHDDLTQMLHARYRYEADLRAFYRRVELGIALEALIEGRDVVIDRTHLTMESRARWVAVGATMGYCPVVAVAFPVGHPADHALRRFGADPRGRTLAEWVAVAVHHAAQAAAEPLSSGEGFAAILFPGGLDR